MGKINQSNNQTRKNKTAEARENRFESFDVIVIGGGAGGMSAALWCEELGLRTLLLEAGAELGGQLLIVHNPILNHLGTETANGRELRDIFLRQLKKRKFEIRKKAEVAEIDLQQKTVGLASGEKFAARALVLATGVSRRRLRVEGEEKFAGRGILESGKRDAGKVLGKTVCIVGGGDAALENALILSETAARVYLVHRRKDFRAREEFLEKVFRNPKVEILTEAVVEKIEGEKRVAAVRVQNLRTQEIYSLAVEAVLVRVGVEPNTRLLIDKLKLDKNGYIRVNRDGETSVKGVFAVGDVANPTAPTVSSAVGMGATAAKAIFSGFILKLKLQ